MSQVFNMRFLALSLLAVFAARSSARPAVTLQRGYEPRAAETKYMFVFGDSYSRTDFSWGSSSQPSPENPMGNPTFGTGTSSGGYNWVNYLTAEYNSSLLYTYDLAVGGSSVDQSIVDTKKVDPDASDFPGQLSSFNAHAADHQDVYGWTSDNTLFAVWFGVNDVNKGYKGGDKNLPLDELYDADIKALFKYCGELVECGAKNFAILNVPPVSRAPESLALPSADRSLLYDAQTIWAAKLDYYFAEFTDQNAGINAHVVDAWTVFNNILDDPSSYGLDSATCANNDGTSCPWWNDLHPGVVIHKYVARAVAKTVTSFFSL